GDHRVRGHLVRVPEGVAARPALVLAFHGTGGNGPGLAGYLGLDAVARRHGFVVAYPDAVRSDWELNRKRGDHDLPRMRRLIAALVDRMCVDRRRVYATGFSNGGSFAFRLGCDLSTRIAAIAPLSGSYKAQRACPRSRGRMPTLEQHGVDQFAVSVPRLLRITRARNRCTRAPVRERVGAAVRTTYPGCALVRYEFRTIGHALAPGTATRVWRFLSRYQRPPTRTR
ncbi:MAG TPA: PHB depolymerase family esterase, partial [Solirubrobacteraceae bacterium]|nr:PHB depolymerase family esterase [Solirubrobacteraceae bacterium]